MIPYAHIADALANAEVTRRPIAAIRSQAQLAVADAYGIQLHNVRRRTATGERIVGMKIGLTSKAMQALLGVEEPDYGHLLSAMRVEDSMPASELIAPRIEPEIGVILERPLTGPGVTELDVLAATSSVVPALEIIDSRISAWDIALVDTIADNGSSARFVLGNRSAAPSGIDLRTLGVALEKNGHVVATGAGAAVLGAGPLLGVAWLANALAPFGISLSAGEVVLTGALCAAVAVEAGDAFVASFAELGDVGVRFT